MKNKEFGILVDQKFKDEFYSCQYLNTEQEWYNYIPNKIKRSELKNLSIFIIHLLK